MRGRNMGRRRGQRALSSRESVALLLPPGHVPSSTVAFFMDVDKVKHFSSPTFHTPPLSPFLFDSLPLLLCSVATGGTKRSSDSPLLTGNQSRPMNKACEGEDTFLRF